MSGIVIVILLYHRHKPVNLLLFGVTMRNVDFEIQRSELYNTCALNVSLCSPK
jgi:hypothetical protein